MATASGGPPSGANAPGEPRHRSGVPAQAFAQTRPWDLADLSHDRRFGQGRLSPAIVDVMYARRRPDSRLTIITSNKADTRDCIW